MSTTLESQATRSPRAIVGVGFALLPAAIFLTLVAVTSTDIPRGDDYPALLQFLCDWREATSFADKLSLLWAQYYSHRIVLTKLFAVLDLTLLGRCDLQLLQASGWTAWTALACGLAFSLPRVRSRPWLASPVFLLLMQPQGYSNFHTAMQAVQNLGVVLLAFGALHAAAQPHTRALAVAGVLALLAGLTSVNGLLVIPVCCVVLAAQRRFKATGIFAMLGVVAWSIFFTGFTRENIPFDPVELATYATVMAGAFAQFDRLPLSFVKIAGAMVLAIPCMLLAFPRVWRRRPVHCAFLLFLLLSIAMAAAGRIGWGADYMLQDRYRLYGLLIVATLLVLATDETAPRFHTTFALATIVGALAFSVLSYGTVLPALLTAARWSRATAMNRPLGVAFPQTGSEAWSHSAAIIERAETHGVYRLPSVFSAPEMEMLESPPHVSAASPIVFTATPNGGVEGALLVAGKGARGDQLASVEFAVIWIDGRPMVLPCERWRAPLAEMLRRHSIFAEHIAFILPGRRYVSGAHPLLGYVRDEGNSLRIAWQATAECPPLNLPGRRELR